MKYDEFKRNVGKAGITLGEFARLVKINPRSLSNYSRQDKIPSHLAVIAHLMGELADHQIDFKPKLSSLDIEPKKIRGAAEEGRFAGSIQDSLPQ